MATPHLSNDEFFNRLAVLLEAPHQKAHGAVHLVQKRLNPVPTSSLATTDDPLADLTPPAAPLPLLVRATNGRSKRAREHKVKLATVVQPEDLAAFYTRYAEVCRAGMSALKRRDRSKKKGKRKKAGDGEKKS